MADDLIEQFQRQLAAFHKHLEPKYQEDVGDLQAALGEILATAERILLYLATHREMADQMLTYLFEYKQLILLQDHLREVKQSLPKKPATTGELSKKPFWKVWGK